MSTAEERRQRRLAHNAKRYAGTYRAIPKLEWETLVACNFNNPDWAALYPINAKGSPAGLLSPRMACKLFYDGVFIIEKSEENPKYLQDKIPEAAHKFYKKKQWRKQLLESARRVCCRMAKGKGFSPNCTAEELFVHVMLQNAVELGWNRCRDQWEELPETDKDRDFNRVARMASNDEISALYRGESVSDSTRFKEYFKAGNSSESAMTDHFLYDIDLSAFTGDDDDEDDS